MADSAFDEFVKRQLDRADNTSATGDIDWDKTRENWLDVLHNLFAQMEEYLKRYIDAGEIGIRRDKISLSENALGTYETEQLTFHIGNEKVIVRPIGTLLIGARGRVDLIGARGTLRLVLLDKGGPALRSRIEIGGRAEEESVKPFLTSGEVKESGWYIATLPPKILTTPLNEDSFRDALMELTDD